MGQKKERQKDEKIKTYTNKWGIACAILALFPIKIPHHGQSQVSLKTMEKASMKSPFAPHLG